ncbi:MAG: hypothetical protein WD601_09095 [Pseudohongiellaceae bacterium]
MVDTVGFLPGRLAGNVPHSNQLHVVERFVPDTERMALEREYIARDPVYFEDLYMGSDTVLPAGPVMHCIRPPPNQGSFCALIASLARLTT